MKPVSYAACEAAFIIEGAKAHAALIVADALEDEKATEAELAAALNVAQTVVDEWLGADREITISELAMIAASLGRKLVIRFDDQDP